MTKKQASSKVHVGQEAKVLGVHAVSRSDILLGGFTAQASRAQALVVGPVTPHNPCIFQPNIDGPRTNLVYSSHQASGSFALDTRRQCRRFIRQCVTRIHNSYQNIIVINKKKYSFTLG
jgi:hypothetical protein